LAPPSVPRAGGRHAAGAAATGLAFVLHDERVRRARLAAFALAVPVAIPGVGTLSSARRAADPGDVAG
jgi:hypothetical protein